MTLPLRVCAAVLVGTLALTSVAAAAPARDAKAQKAARGHFQKAEKAFGLGRFEEALASYERAFDVMPLPGFLFNIAQCHRNLENHERALFFYRRYLALDPESANRALVEELIAEEEQALADQARARARAKAALAEQEAEENAPPVSLAAPPPKPTNGRLVKSPATESTTERFLRDNWMWLGIGAVVVAGVATALMVGGGESAPPRGDLGRWDIR